MAAREIVVTLRLSEGTTREQFRALKSALIDVKSEIGANNKALRDNKKEQDALSKSIKDAGVATEAQAVREHALLQERERLKITSADLAQSEASVSAQFRESRNEVSGLSDAHLRFRDKMAQATIEALKQQGVLGQLGARLDFVRSEQDRLNQEQLEGKGTSEQLRAALDKLGLEEKELVAQTTALNGKIDALAKQLKEGAITAEQFRAETQAINASVQQVGSSVSKGVSDLKSYALGFVGVIAAAQAAIRVIGSVSSTIADFDQQLANIRALGAEYAASIDEIAEASIRLGPKLGVAPVEALKAFEALAKAGLETQQILSGGLEAALTLAAAGPVETAEAAETIATALVQFNIQGERATQVADLLAKGSNIAKGNVSDFAAALNQSGLVASQFGLTIEETIGGLTGFAKAGLVGSDAGTSFRQALLHLQNPTKKAKEILAAYGIELVNANGEFLSLAEIAGQLQSKLADLTEEQRGAALATIFGSDAIRVANILYNQGAEGVARFTKEVNDSGFATQLAETKLDSVSGSSKKFGAAWDAMVLSVDNGNSVLSQGIRGLIDAYTEFLGIISGNNEFQNFKNDLDAIFDESGINNLFGGEQAQEAEDTISGILRAIRRVKAETKDPVELKVQLQDQALSIKDEIAKVKKELEDGDIAPKIGESKIFALEILLEDEINVALDDQAEALRKISAEKKGIIDQNKQAIALADAEGDAVEDIGEKRSRLNEELKAEKASRDKLALTDTAGIAASNDRIKAIKSELDALKSFSFESKNVSGGLADLNDQIAKLKEQQSQSATSAQFQKYQEQIDGLNESVDLLTGKLSQDMLDAANTVPEFIEPTAAQAPLAQAQPLETEQDRIDNLFGLQVAGQEQSLNSLIEYYATREALGFEFSEQEKATFEDLKDAKAAVLSAEINGAAAFGQSLIQLAKDGSTAAKIGLVISKVAAIASVLIDTARGITAAQVAAASIPPLIPPGIPNPAFPAAQAIAAAQILALKVTAGVNIGTIAAQTIAGFDDGGFVQGNNGFIQRGWGKSIRRSNGDNVLITAREGEVILNEGQQSVLERMMGGGIWHRLGVPNSTTNGAYATGGHVTYSRGTALVNLRVTDLENTAVRNVLAELQPVVSISEINKVQARVQVTESLASA